MADRSTPGFSLAYKSFFFGMGGAITGLILVAVGWGSTALWVSLAGLALQMVAWLLLCLL
jgi:hypothetical protein